MTKPDIPGEQDFLVPALVEGDMVADVPMTHIGLLRQHPGHKHVVHPEDPLVTVLEHLEELVPDKVTHNVDHAPAVGRKELIGPLIKGNHLKRTIEDIIRRLNIKSETIISTEKGIEIAKTIREFLKIECDLGKLSEAILNVTNQKNILIN